jgi:hypothetical protein
MTVQSFKKNWGILIQIATAIGGIVGVIIVPPSVIEPIISAARAKAFGVFVTAIIVSVFLYFAKRRASRKTVPRWVFATLLFLFLSVVSFFCTLKLIGSKTCMYAGQAVPIGTVYTEKGNNYMSENKEGMDCETLINDFGGKTSEIWSDSSITNSRLVLLAAYLTTFILMALTVLGAVQLVFLLTQAHSSSR